MKRAISLTLAGLLILALFAGCAEKGALSLEFGQTQKIELAKDYASLSWESSDPAVATVTDGTVEAVGPGQATVTALSDGKTVASYTVQVTIVEIAELFLQMSEMSLKIDETSTLTYTLFPANASAYGLTYTSINPEIATVDQSGKVVGVAPGKTNIVLSTSEGKTATCEVTVLEPTAIEQLNEEEAKLFTYIATTAYTSFYNASALRFRNLYTIRPKVDDYEITASSFLLADFQGTNKLGGTIHRYYMISAPESPEDNGGFVFPCKSDYTLDTSTYMEMPRDIIDYTKVNAALDEYWGITIKTS